MLLIVAVLGLFLVSTNALELVLGANGGILTSEVKKTFKDSNEIYNKKMKWDDNLANEALKEAEERWSSNQTLAIYHKWKFESQKLNETKVSILDYTRELLQKYGQWLQTLPAVTRYGCNGIVNILFGHPEGGLEITAACVYKVE